MAGRAKKEPEKRPPATTPDLRENQLVSLAADLAEKRMREGTASAQEIVHFLKLGSSRERLEQERLGSENDLLKAKVEVLASEKRMEELYTNVISALRRYSGDSSPEEDYLDD